MLLGITEAPPDVSFAAMTDRQRAVADVVRADPDVATVASFIGADGTNPTLSTGRLSIALEAARQARTATRRQIIDRLGAQAARARRHHRLPAGGAGPADREPRQPDAVPVHDRGRRPDRAGGLGAARPRPPAPAARAGRRRQRSAGGRAPADAGHRSRQRRAAGHHAPQAIDDTLYDAFGQRQVSTIFTQLNLYRVILEVDPRSSRTRTRSTRSTCAAPAGQAVPLSALRALRARRRPPSRSRTRGSSRRSRCRSTWRPAPRWATPCAPSARRWPALDAPPGLHGDFQGAAAAFGDSLSTEPFLILAAIVTVYIVLGVLYESYIHPVTILSTLPSAGVGAFLALIALPVRVLGHRAHRDRPAHRHREEERHHDDRLRARGRARAGQVAARGDPPGLPAALPARS